jgi:cell division protein FtsN
MIQKSLNDKASPFRNHPRQSRGSAVPAFVFGMVFGLLIALGVALFVSKSSVSFSGPNAQTTAPVASPKVSSGEGGTLPDPNAAIYNKVNAKRDLVTSGAASEPPSTPAATPAQPESKPLAQALYFLQLGSFKNRDDAEQLRAKLAFLGTESEVSVGEVNGSTVNRVRVGPFSSANAAYQARVPLTKGGFDAAVVKE